MDPADIFSFPQTEQERAGRQVIIGDGIAHFNNDEIVEVSGFQIGTMHPGAIAFTGRKVLQDIGPFLLDPEKDILSGWADAVTKYFAAEPALLT